MNSGQLVQPSEFRGKEALLRFDHIGHNITTFDVYAETSSKIYASGVDSDKIKVGKPFLQFDLAKTPPQPD